MTETYTYDSYGNLATIKIGGQRVWELSSYNGTYRTIKLGEAPLTLSKSYSSSSGALSSTTISNTNGPLHIFSYGFDGSGNLTNRYGMTGSNETFSYDEFDRLKTGVSYFINGNINSKTGIGNYTYDANKKNAVVQVQNSGNLIPKENVDVTYNAFNKVSTITQGSNKLTITYGPDRQRVKTVLVYGGTTTTTLYAGNYEQRTAGGVTTTYHYVASPDGMIAVYVKKNGTTTPYYVETDHLGSIINLFDASGTKQFSATYDAWGKQTITKNAIGLTRGYTGHEHWNQFGLIDMNGRFYDPLIGRFLSPDPYVQAPYNLQNFNRYSYCLNNPLKYTDPSGYRIDSFEDEERDSKRSCYYMKQYDGQRCGGGGYSVGDMINDALSNNTKQLIASMSDSWSIYGKETSTVGNWVTYWYEIRGYNNREVYVIAGEINVYETISNNTKIIMPRSYNDYSSGGGDVAAGASYANTVINSAFKSTDKAPNAKLGSNNLIYWEGKFHGNQYVTVKSLSSVAKPIARGTGILGVGISAADILYTMNNEGYFGPETQAATVEVVGGIAGGIAGAKLGAMAGGAIGVWVGGIGAIPGAVIGGFIGGVGGSFGGAYATDKAYEYYINKQ